MINRELVDIYGEGIKKFCDKLSEELSHEDLLKCEVLGDSYYEYRDVIIPNWVVVNACNREEFRRIYSTFKDTCFYFQELYDISTDDITVCLNGFDDESDRRIPICRI